MMTDLTLPGFEHATGEPFSAAVSSLIESAAASFETDPKTSRELLAQACALLRAKRRADRQLENASQAAPLIGGLAPWRVSRVVAYIETHLATRIQAEDLAKLINVSTGQFFRGFKISVGIPPFEYIRQRRLEFAMELLQTTSEPMSQIAIASGLSDQSQLCRIFRRTFGQSPGAWRRANAFDPALGVHRGSRDTRTGLLA